MSTSTTCPHKPPNTSNKYPFDPAQIRTLITQLTLANISLEDMTKAVQLFGRVSDCLNSLQMPLPPHNLYPEHLQYLAQLGKSSSSVEIHKLVHILQKLRDLAVALLSKKVGPRIEDSKNLNYANNNTNPTNNSNKRVPSSSVNQVRGRFTTSEDRFTNRVCYICKKLLQKDANFNFNAWMCLPCGELNLAKRVQSADLRGKIALVTGARVKIGYQVALKLLRAGADRVIITTRFPVDALRRFEEEEDFTGWRDKLHIYGLDLRFLQHVKDFCAHFERTYPRLDVLVQNAAQTIRRPAVFYKHLLQAEAEGHGGNDKHGVIQNWNKNLKIQISHHNGNSAIEPPPPPRSEGQSAPAISAKDNAHLSQLLVHSEDYNYADNGSIAKRDFPQGKVDEDEQQLDLRRENSWTMRLDQVETSEVVEVALVNYLAPYTILQKLTPLMKQGRSADTPHPELGWIVLVSAMEGKFMDLYKSCKHPHTNSAKAALNMIVRTCGTEYRGYGLLLSAVDTGWVTEEHPLGYQQPGLSPPLDCVDGAARVLDPVFACINSGTELYGRFIKDYAPTSW